LVGEWNRQTNVVDGYHVASEDSVLVGPLELKLGNTAAQFATEFVTSVTVALGELYGTFEPQGGAVEFYLPPASLTAELRPWLNWMASG
jgi:hypothetical protein